MENRKEPAEANPAANSSGSAIAIGSIYIELPLPPPPKMDPTQCNDHSFSIRGFSLSNRGKNRKLSSLFPSIGESDDKELPPIETPKNRYWGCPECVNEVIESAGGQLDTTAEISEDIQPIGTDSGLQLVLVPENSECSQSAGTDAGMLQVIVPENVEDVPSIGPDAGMLQVLSSGAVEEIRSFGTISGIQPSSVVRSTDCIQSIGANIIARSTEGINADENTVETSALPSNTPKITSAEAVEISHGAEAVEISHTGEKNAPIDPMEDVVVTGERLKAKTGRRTIGGNAKVPAGKVKTKSGDISTRGGHKSTNRKKRLTPPEKVKVTSVERETNGISAKTDETENDRCRDNENSNGNTKRKVKKVRLLTDLMGEKDNPSVKSTERNSTTSSLLLESAESGNAVLEGQVGCEKDVANGLQSPRRKAKASLESEEANDPCKVASNVKDTGKAPMIVDIPDSNVNIVSFGGEGLFLGTKTERLRRRSEITPSVSKKKNKPTDVLDFSASSSFLVPLFQASSAPGSWGSHPSAEQIEQNHAGLLSAGLNSQPSFNRSEQVGLDLSLGSFSRSDCHQDSKNKAYLKKDDTLFGKSNIGPTSELNISSSKGQHLDLNEKTALIPYNLDMNKFPVHTEADFLKLGLQEKNANHENPKEIDQRADEFPMDIVDFLVNHQHDKNSYLDVIPVVQRSSDLTSQYLVGEAPTTMNDLGRVYPVLYGVPPFQTPHATSVAREHGRMHQGSPVTLAHLNNNHINLFQTPSIGLQISPSASVRDGPHHPQAMETLSSTFSRQTFGFGIQQKQAAEYQKGITISDIKLNDLRNSEEARLIYKSGGSAIGSKSKLPLAYRYTKEDPPAVQYLSLMDGGSSGTALSLGTTKILNKPFSPCSYHPKFSREEQLDMMNGSMPFRQSLTKEPPTPGTNLFSNQSLIPYSAANQLSLYTPEKDISRNKSQNPGSSGGRGPSCSHAKDKQMAITDAANSMERPPTYQRYVNANQPILEAIIVPTRSGSGRQYSADGVCTTNRNPAEIGLPEEKRYTICGKDLKSRKRKPYAKRTASTAVGDAKRQRTKKGRPGDEQPKENPSGGK